MRKVILIFGLVLASFQFVSAQSTPAPQFKVITVVESIVPGGLGRSRLIENGTELNIDEFTTERTDGKKSGQGKIKRKDAKVDRFKESKLLNFYSFGGINFQNIASNDALIASKLNQLSEEGWELVFVTSGVESDSGASEDIDPGAGTGIFITRFIFKKKPQ
ncbi:MAG: hypothetical protein ACPGJS_03420 [Flammeovirgaceae bacterium]